MLPAQKHLGDGVSNTALNVSHLLLMRHCGACPDGMSLMGCRTVAWGKLCQENMKTDKGPL